MKEQFRKIMNKARSVNAVCSRWISGHRPTVLLICVCVMILMTAVKYSIYKETEFSDAYAMMEAVLSGDLSGGDFAFQSSAGIFSALFSGTGISSLRSWSWILLLPGAAVFLFVVWKAPAMNLFSALTAIGFSILLSYFVFMPSVDFFQYITFFLMALILLYVPGQIGKLAGSIAVLLPVIILFRDYYLLMAVGAAALFGIAILYRKPKTAAQQAVFLAVLASVIILILLLLKVIAPEKANELFSIRTRTNLGFASTPVADKMILDVLPMDRSVPGFLVNYLTAAARILIPAELCVSLTDVPFFVFQLILDVLILVELVRSRRVFARTAVYAMVIAFFLMSFCFEPNFGSWFRHEAAAFPVLWLGIGHDRQTYGGREREEV